MKLDELLQPGWGDTADKFHHRDKKYGTAESKVLAVVISQMENVAAASAPTTFGERLETLDIVPRKSQMPQRTS